MVCVGAMLQRSMALTRPSTIGLFAGADLECLTGFSLLWQLKVENRMSWWLIPASEGWSNRCLFLKKGVLSRCIGRTKGGLNSKLHAVCDGQEHPIMMLLTEGNQSDFVEAVLMVEAFPEITVMITDWGTMPIGSGKSSMRMWLTMPSTQKEPHWTHRRWCQTLQKTPQDREYVRETKGLETYRNTLWPMRPHILFLNPDPRNNHILDQ